MSRRGLGRASRLAPFDVIVVAPTAEEPWPHRIHACIRMLFARLHDSGRDKQDVLALTFFTHAADKATCARHRMGMRTLLRELFDGDPPPAGVVAQAPQGHRRITLEATVLSVSAENVAVARRTCRGTRYTVVSGNGTRQVHCSGISSDRALDDPAAQSTDAFEKMEAVLRSEGLTFGHVVRQWGYIEGVLDLRADCPLGHQAYQAFNDTRTLAYGKSEFPTGYPAATGIGQAAGGVALDFIAIDAPAEVSIAPLSNPRQTDAHRYSAGMLVGEALEAVTVKSTPKFERAKAVASQGEEVIFVSGTAAIVGERSVAPGDVSLQTQTTIDNIAALIGDRRLSQLRAYVKRSEDIPSVRRLCEAAFGNIPAIYVTADVCRDELLVELEGALTRRTIRNPPCEDSRCWPRS